MLNYLDCREGPKIIERISSFFKFLSIFFCEILIFIILLLKILRIEVFLMYTHYIENLLIFNNIL